MLNEATRMCLVINKTDLKVYHSSVSLSLSLFFIRFNSTYEFRNITIERNNVEDFIESNLSFIDLIDDSFSLFVI